jgi:uncharacterized protein YndB with AHSA1/START domain
MTGDAPDAVLVVRRVIAAPRERAFDAWLDPARLAQFMCPGPVGSARAEVDPRVGGAFRIVMRHPNGDADHRGEYLVIDRPSKLEFTWISAATDRRPTVVTVEFLARDGGTEVVLTHRRLPPPQLDSHRKGWGDIVQKLGAAVASSGRA